MTPHKLAKRKARQRRNRRCHNIGTLYGNAARVQQENVHEKGKVWNSFYRLLGFTKEGKPRTHRHKDWS
jgi:hypothetical protein